MFPKTKHIQINIPFRDVAKLIIKKDGIESLFDEVSKKSLFLMLESKRPGKKRSF